MGLAASCPRCSSPVQASDGGWRCLEHDDIVPLWRPAVAGYDAFAEHLGRSASLPSLVPWPLVPGWQVTDFGCVALPGRPARASFVSCAGSSEPDGVVELTVVAEEPGVGLGARCAGIAHSDPGADMGEGPPQARLRVDNRPVPMWSVPSAVTQHGGDRSVLAGEAHGRWLWLLLRPASAALLLRDEWSLADVNELGPALVDLPFGGTPPTW